MKKRARDRLPKRVAGSFPSFLYKSLDELEGVAAQAEGAGQIVGTDQWRRKPLLILSDLELDEAVLMRIGLPWIRALTLQRLSQEPLREGIVGAPGDLLRNALKLGRQAWAEYAAELEAIAAPLLPTLPHDEEHAPLHEAWSAWQRG